MTMKGANFLEKLLDGQKVEWKKLGEVCNVLRGRRLTKKDMIEDGEYLVYQNSMIPLGRYNKYNVKGGTTYVICAGSAGEIGYSSEDFWAADDVSYFECPEFVHSKFLYYYLLTQQQRILRQVRKAGVPRLAPDVLRQLLIPLPSLSVQSRIVEILDKFTSLEAELEAELDCRKRQYIYYRELLLDFSDENKYPNVEWKKLGEVAENLDNMRRPVTGSNRVAGEYPYYGASGIVDYVDNYIFDGDYLLVSEDGANLTARKTPIAFSISGKNWVNNHAHVLKFETYVERKFVEYYLNNLDISEYVSGAAQPKLNKANLNRIPIPLLPLSEQARIVEILDKFDALTNSITEGLPLEIKLRRQQYEYYREQLLNFPHH